MIISSEVGLRRSSKALPRAKLALKNRIMVTVWWSAASRIHYSFLSPSEIFISEKYAQQIDEMHCKLKYLQPGLVNRRGLTLLCENTRLHITQPTLQKWNKVDYRALFHLPYSPNLSPTNYHFFKYLDNFLYGKCFHDQQDLEMLSNSLPNP